MDPTRGTPFARGARLAKLRAALSRAGLDAFVVSHLPNVQYLTGLSASAAVAVVTADSATLAVDFRYQTAAARAVEDEAGVVVDVVAGSFEEWLEQHLVSSRYARIGIEAASVTVSRFNRLSAAIGAAAPLPLRQHGPVPALVPTERVVEALRLVKDEEEVQALREGARRLSAIARRLPELARIGRTEQAVAGTSTPPCAPRGSSARPSRPSWPRDPTARFRTPGPAPGC
jgi:Xaa-Pro aminopeptidase